MHYYSFNIGDYTSHTAHLTPIEDIAYRRLLDLYYQTETPIQDNITAVCRQIRLRDHEDDVRQILSEFFTLQDGVWVSARCDREIEEYHIKGDIARANGKKGGRPKKLTEPTNNPAGSSSFDLANPDITQAKANHKPLTNNQETLNNNQRESADKSASSRGKLFKTYLQDCKDSGAKVIPDEHYIFKYADDAGISKDLMGLCWLRFKEEHTAGARKNKRQKDWPGTFANCVKDNWYGFWYVKDGVLEMSSKCELYKKTIDAQRARGE